MTLPKILALDLATRLGWAVGSPDEEPRYVFFFQQKTAYEI